MKRILIGAILMLLPSAAMAQSLNDQVTLANDGLFLQRVRQSAVFEAINISSDGLTGGINTERHAQVASIMKDPDAWKSQFASAVATQPSVINPATATGTVVLKPMVCLGQPVGTCTETGNVDTQQALVTDAVINNSVLFVFNAFFGGQ